MAHGDINPSNAHARGVQERCARGPRVGPHVDGHGLPGGACGPGPSSGLAQTCPGCAADRTSGRGTLVAGDLRQGFPPHRAPNQTRRVRRR